MLSAIPLNSTGFVIERQRETTLFPRHHTVEVQLNFAVDHSTCSLDEAMRRHLSMLACGVSLKGSFNLICWHSHVRTFEPIERQAQIKQIVRSGTFQYREGRQRNQSFAYCNCSATPIIDQNIYDVKLFRQR